jgi:hypothetical protein
MIGKPLSSDALLKSLGIDHPRQIDLEAIAWHLGAVVRYQRLDGCDARIIGAADRAIITVNSRTSQRRQRFSIGHEIGHWLNDRGRTLFCQPNDTINKTASVYVERSADKFSAGLLMPEYLFRPATLKFSKLYWSSIKELAELFSSSISATAIRIFSMPVFAGMVVCHRKGGREWFQRSPNVPSKWFPRDELDCRSSAMNVLFGALKEDSNPKKISAQAWFETPDASAYEIQEQSIKIDSSTILTLLVFSDQRMLAS